jgi:phosphate transport system substrate-binding protein
LTNKLTALVALSATSVLVLAGCAAQESASPSPTATSASPTETAVELSGNILVDGSSTVGPASEVAAELFMEVNPGVRIAVNISGTGGGFEKFCNGETDGSNASRLIKESEAAICEANGIAYDYVVVANDALSVVVNKDNPLSCISVEALATIWGPDATGKVMNWGDAGISDLPAELASVPLTLYGPGTDSGTFDFFTGAINGEEGAIRTDYTNIGEEDLAAVQGVSGTLGAMGFIPYSYYQEYQDQVKALAIDGGAGCVEPTIENVQAQTYAPLGRGLFTYASSTALARPEVQAFFRFLVEETELINSTAGYVGLTPEQQVTELAKLEALLG